jgi:hypothetical protein
MFKIEQLITQEFAMLKGIYLDLLTNSMSYPFIAQAELIAFSESLKIIDNNFKSAFVDINYVATMSNARFSIKNKAGLIRCEFLEFLVRVSSYKYVNSG